MKGPLDVLQEVFKGEGPKSLDEYTGQLQAHIASYTQHDKFLKDVTPRSKALEQIQAQLFSLPCSILVIAGNNEQSPSLPFSAVNALPKVIDWVNMGLGSVNTASQGFATTVNMVRYGISRVGEVPGLNFFSSAATQLQPEKIHTIRPVSEDFKKTLRIYAEKGNDGLLTVSSQTGIVDGVNVLGSAYCRFTKVIENELPHLHEQENYNKFTQVASEIKDFIYNICKDKSQGN